MEPILNAFKAPFSDTAAADTTPGKIALAYGIAGLLIGAFVLGK